MTETLEQVQRQLQLIQALDSVRDSYGDEEDPRAMFTAMTRLLVEEFSADSCGIMLLAADNEGIELLASTEMPTSILLDLSQRALKFDQWTPVEALDHTLAAPLMLNDEALGAIVLARADPAFSDAEKALLILAETQINSAVIQARTIWKYRQRNQELAAIHEIDQLRDYTPNEFELIGGFTSTLLQYFQADLCMIILSHSESGELILRGVMDRNALPSTALDSIRDTVASLNSIQTIDAPAGFPELNLLAAPLFVSNSRLGGIVVGSRQHFRASERHLLQVMIEQMDSAIAYSRIHQQLENRNKELEVIYRIDQIRDQELEFDSHAPARSGRTLQGRVRRSRVISLLYSRIARKNPSNLSFQSCPVATIWPISPMCCASFPARHLIWATCSTITCSTRARSAPSWPFR